MVRTALVSAATTKRVTIAIISMSNATVRQSVKRNAKGAWYGKTLRSFGKDAEILMLRARRNWTSRCKVMRRGIDDYM